MYNELENVGQEREKREFPSYLANDRQRLGDALKECVEKTVCRSNSRLERKTQ